MIKSERIKSLSDLLESNLEKILDSHQMDLYSMMRHHLGWQNENDKPKNDTQTYRKHGVTCLTVCQILGGDIKIALPAAASLELVNAFCEIHDDVQGGNPKRGNRDAVWWLWGPAQAINAGDGIHALARLTLFQLHGVGVPPDKTFEAIQIVDKASLELCEGRFQDLESQERIDISVNNYLEMASLKTGSLYSCAMELGALISSADNTVTQSFKTSGYKLGLAIQIKNDIKALWEEKDVHQLPNPEVLNKKKLLPVVYALEKATIGEKRRLGEIYFKRVLDPEDIPCLQGILEELGAKKHCEELVEKYQQQALGIIEPSLSSDGVTSIHALVDWIFDPYTHAKTYQI